MSNLSKYLQMAAADLRQVRPTAADQKREPKALSVWCDDVEHTIKVQEIPADLADEFRALSGAK